MTYADMNHTMVYADTNHAMVTEHLIRPPGTPPSQCSGYLVRVSPDGELIPPKAPAILDDCQAGEGEIGDLCEVTLWRCRKCRTTLVIAQTTDGTLYGRNEWNKETATV